MRADYRASDGGMLPVDADRPPPGVCSHHLPPLKQSRLDWAGQLKERFKWSFRAVNCTCVSALLDIGEVAARSGMAPSTLRYYEREQIIVSIERKGRRRQYASNILDTLAVVAICQRAGFTLAEIRELLATYARPWAAGSDAAGESDEGDEGGKDGEGFEGCDLECVDDQGGREGAGDEGYPMPIGPVRGRGRDTR